MPSFPRFEGIQTFAALLHPLHCKQCPLSFGVGRKFLQAPWCETVAEQKQQLISQASDLGELERLQEGQAQMERMVDELSELTSVTG